MVQTYDVIAYCGGKCGSWTITRTLEATGRKAIHAHGNEDYQLYYKKEYTIYDAIEKSAKQHKIYLIDSYRDPIERKMSAFFHKIKVNIPDYKTRSIDSLIETFNSQYLLPLENYHPLSKIMKHYDVSQFASFDFHKKYNLAEKDNIVFIKIRFKDIEKWDKILSSIFKEDIKLQSENLTENRDFFDIYQEFKKKYYLTSSLLDQVIKNDKLFLIYNSKEEQKEYIKLWLQKCKA